MFFAEDRIKAVREMICARMTGRTDLWIPDDFGTYVTADTPEDYKTLLGMYEKR